MAATRLQAANYSLTTSSTAQVGGTVIFSTAATLGGQHYFAVPMRSGAAITAGHILTLDATGRPISLATIDKQMAGVALNATTAADQLVMVAVSGIVEMISDVAITAGSHLGSTTTASQVGLATGGKARIGMALSATSAGGQIILGVIASANLP